MSYGALCYVVGAVLCFLAVLRGETERANENVRQCEDTVAWSSAIKRDSVHATMCEGELMGMG